MKTLIPVEVAYALPKQQRVFTLDVELGCTARAAVLASGVLATFPDIDIETARMGIFSQLLDDAGSYVLSAGERVEIYRPLLIDPKEARRLRAAKAKLN